MIDTDSRELNGPATYTRHDLICESDATCYAIARLIVARHASADERISSIEITPAAAPATLWPAVFALRPRDRIAGVRRPPGGFEIIRQLFVDAIEHRISYRQWTTTVTTSPAPTYQYAVAGRFVAGDTSVLVAP